MYGSECVCGWLPHCSCLPVHSTLIKHALVLHKDIIQASDSLRLSFQLLHREGQHVLVNFSEPSTTAQLLSQMESLHMLCTTNACELGRNNHPTPLLGALPEWLRVWGHVPKRLATG